MSKELKITLPISTENESIISIVAQKAGWTTQQMNIDGTPKAPEAVCGDILSNFIAEKISESFSWFYGESQKSTRDLILAAVKQNLIIEFEEK